MAWFALENADDALLDDLAKRYDLHSVHIEDARSSNERIKTEVTEGYIFLVLKSVQTLEDGSLEYSPVSIFCGRDFCVTVSNPGCSSAREALTRARAAGPDASPSKIVYLIFDSIVDAYFPARDRFDDQLDDIEDRVLESPAPEVMQQIFDQKRELIEVRRVLVNTRDACMQLQREAAGPLVDDDLWPFFRDIYDHILRLVDSIENSRDLLNNTLDIYLSSVANRTNDIMKVLTVVSTVTLPALLISSIYGMNLKSLPFADAQYGTWIVAGIMLGLTLFLLWMLRKFRWL